MRDEPAVPREQPGTGVAVVAGKPDYIAARREMIKALREELVGPCPRGKAIDLEATVSFETYKDAQGPFRQITSGDEVLTGDRPTKRYGVGVLYPWQTALDTDPPSSSDEDEATLDAIEEEAAANAGRDDVAADIRERKRLGAHEDDDDLPLTTANSYRPSSFGLSFLCDLSDISSLAVELTGARYREKEVLVEEKGSTLSWWLRQEIKVTATFAVGELLPEGKNGRVLVKPQLANVTGNLPEDMDLQITILTRPRSDSKTLLTVSTVNRSKNQSADAVSLFQAQMTCRAGTAASFVLPYEERQRFGDDKELDSLNLLYRDVPAFAIGHGCSADWEAQDGESVAASVCTAALPEVEVPSTTPDIPGPDGKPIAVPMSPLAGLDQDDDGLASLQHIVDGYRAWIETQQELIAQLAPGHQPVAESHLELCGRACDRMQEGVRFLTAGEDPHVIEAFKLANNAMLLQQQHSGAEVRETVYDRDTRSFTSKGKFVPRTEGRGTWRPFQIAFVLAALKSTATGDDLDRETVELIFFPTGGGKTEAYLALTAFSIFYRRLRDPQDVGVDVLMRYTLRLLTADQTRRAATLICAMDSLRAKDAERLGKKAISIGVWLGGSTTPNSREEAVRQFKKLSKDKSEANPFVLLRCPWCAAQMGPIEAVGKGRAVKNEPQVAGYRAMGDTVVLKCPDVACEFHDRLPVFVIDDDVYEQRPSLVIGTVDKFAGLAFRPEARTLFGIGDDGERQFSPPNLIIQDELHLISGPLGSMVGLYETVINELATDNRGAVPVPPKIIASTATIRRYEEQVMNLYCRPTVALFPPRGLDAGDSYFASYAREENGKLKPGRVYVGIHGTGLGSFQTAQVRTYTALLQAAFMLEPDVQDPWWTLLVFFNSLRELGTSVSLLQSDIPDYFRVIAKRLGLAPEEVRRIWKDTELTGRLRNDEVPRAIEELEIKRADSSKHPVDVCLASNIIEVGVDIDRLSLMSVAGQPKTTAQYIQATGRVGRSWWERPGLVAMIYGASKPRDRSHFEKFRSYHERLYAQVEPTSVTPFAPPVLDRALHAVMVAYVRQLSVIGTKPAPVPEDLLSQARELLLARVQEVDDEETQELAKIFDKRVAQWKRWNWPDWKADHDSPDPGLTYYAGNYVEKNWQRLSWALPTSLRNVDAECRAEITHSYLLADGESEDGD